MHEIENLTEEQRSQAQRIASECFVNTKSIEEFELALRSAGLGFRQRIYAVLCYEHWKKNGTDFTTVVPYE